MKITDTMPFAAELLRPTYEEVFRREDARAGAGEVYVDETWGVVLYSTQEMVQVAADHLKAFLAQSMGGDTSVCGVEKRLVLDVEPDLDANPETHLIRVAEDKIEVIGAGPVGVLRGVFRLENLMKEQGGPILPIGEEKRVPLFKHRIHRSCFSPFYKDELTGYYGDPFNVEWLSPGMAYPAYIEEDAGPEMFYHDNMLMRLAEHGFNGVWIRGSFRHFAKVSVFPEFGRNSDVIVSRLRDLAQRGARYGIKVFLYLNEPLCIAEDDEFFKNHPQCKGAPAKYKPMVHLCTSTPEIKTYLKESSNYLFTQVPELAGFLMITASEYPSHCWSHTGIDPEHPDQVSGEVEACPRCRERTPQDTVGELVQLVRDGAKAAKPEAEIIAWNWSWRMWEPDPQTGVLEALPEDVIVMGDYERGEPTEALGFEYTNDEYSIKVVGPSQRFKGVADYQLGHGRPVYAKLQIGTTHENPDIPCLPTMQKIAQKYQTLKATGVTGMMTCWNFGNMPSRATEVAGEFSFDPQPEDINAALRRITVRNFGPEAADEVVRAWEMLSVAHDDFPSSIPVMYHGPLSRGPAFLFMFDQVNKKFPHSWLLDKDIEGDIMDWASPFGPEKVLECFRSEATKGWEAIAVLEGASGQTRGEDNRRLQREIGLCKLHIIQTQSAANVVDFLLTRNAYYESSDSAQRRELLDRMEAICRQEAENARAAIPLMRADTRLGWHGEAYGYMISPELVEQKLQGLQDIVERRIPEARASL